MPDAHSMLGLLETKGLAANAMLSQLEANFPPTNPTPSTTMETIMYQAGQRSVVEWIKDYMEQE